MTLGTESVYLEFWETVSENKELDGERIYLSIEKYPVWYSDHQRKNGKVWMWMKWADGKCGAIGQIRK